MNLNNLKTATGLNPQKTQIFKHYRGALKLMIGAIAMSLVGSWITHSHFNIEQTNNQYPILKENMNEISTFYLDKTPTKKQKEISEIDTIFFKSRVF